MLPDTFCSVQTLLDRHSSTSQWVNWTTEVFPGQRLLRLNMRYD